MPDHLAWPSDTRQCSVKEASRHLYHCEAITFDKGQWVGSGKPHNGISQDCPHCIQPESTIHVLQDCHWAREFWIAFLGNLQLDFFQLPLPCWLHQNFDNKLWFPTIIYLGTLCLHLDYGSYGYLGMLQFLDPLITLPQVEVEYVPKPAELDDGMDEEFKNIFHKFSFHETAATQEKYEYDMMH
ncbi:hypothetical protein CFP56_021431 [Quercus suber]|uniref:Reverse transcriptase zinc-binding domain-containing protein n=1 Tax=Quercus suber TaxID=58331 RepID=A0AAW0KFN9_QUESU